MCFNFSWAFWLFSLHDCRCLRNRKMEYTPLSDRSSSTSDTDVPHPIIPRNPLRPKLVGEEADYEPSPDLPTFDSEGIEEGAMARREEIMRRRLEEQRRALEKERALNTAQQPPPLPPPNAAQPTARPRPRPLPEPGQQTSGNSEQTRTTEEQPASHERDYGHGMEIGTYGPRVFGPFELQSAQVGY